MNNEIVKKTQAILAEFETPTALMKGAEALRDAGYKKFDCHSSFPIHGMDKAMGLKRSPLGWMVGLAAFIGASGALTLQWWTSTINYPLVISGKPLFSFQAYVPITFALGVVLSAGTALIGMLALNGLPRYHHPVFYSDRFARFSNDSFFISVEATDKKFHIDQTKALLEQSGGKNIEILEGE